MSKNALKISKHIPSVLQGSLDFSAAQAISLSREMPIERHVLRILLIVIAALACAYLYFVCTSVLNVIARKEAMVKIINVQSEISEQEQEFFKLSQNITPEMAPRFGLAPASAPEYVYRPSNTVAATIGANEI